MYWRKASTAAVAASALRAAAVEPRGPTSPASIAPIGRRAIPQIGAASAPPCAWPQQSMPVSSQNAAGGYRLRYPAGSSARRSQQTDFRAEAVAQWQNAVAAA